MNTAHKALAIQLTKSDCKKLFAREWNAIFVNGSFKKNVYNWTSSIVLSFGSFSLHSSYPLAVIDTHLLFWARWFGSFANYYSKFCSMYFFSCILTHLRLQNGNYGVELFNSPLDFVWDFIFAIFAFKPMWLKHEIVAHIFRQEIKSQRTYIFLNWVLVYKTNLNSKLTEETQNQIGWSGNSSNFTFTK